MGKLNVRGVVSNGRVDSLLVDTRQIATDAEQFDSTDAEQRGDVVVRHRDLQVDRVIQRVWVGTD